MFPEGFRHACKELDSVMEGFRRLASNEAMRHMLFRMWSQSWRPKGFRSSRDSMRESREQAWDISSAMMEDEGLDQEHPTLDIDDFMECFAVYTCDSLSDKINFLFNRINSRKDKVDDVIDRRELTIYFARNMALMTAITPMSVMNSAEFRRMREQD